MGERALRLGQLQGPQRRGPGPGAAARAGPVWRAQKHLQQAELPAQAQGGERLAAWGLVLQKRLGAWELLVAWVAQQGPDSPDEVAAVLVLPQEHLERAPM